MSEQLPPPIVPPPPLPPTPMLPQQPAFYASPRPGLAVAAAVIMFVLAFFDLLAFIPMGNTPYVGHAFGVADSAVAIIIYLTMGIALLRMIPWARKRAVQLLWARLGLLLVGSGYLLVANYQQMVAGKLSGNLWNSFVITVTVMLISGILLLALLLIFLTRPHVVEAYDAQQRQEGDAP